MDTLKDNINKNYCEKTQKDGNSSTVEQIQSSVERVRRSLLMQKSGNEEEINFLLKRLQ